MREPAGQDDVGMTPNGVSDEERDMAAHGNAQTATLLINGDDVLADESESAVGRPGHTLGVDTAESFFAAREAAERFYYDRTLRLHGRSRASRALFGHSADADDDC